MSPTKDRAREVRLRRLAIRSGYQLRKSRVTTAMPTNRGGYQLLQLAPLFYVVHGRQWELDLDDVEEWLTGLESI